ncbi:SDR family oxidoreductase [Aurantimonas sp. C2-6-R+9]|uniref:SDR family NAD(P)-dependent oxidoreductase n=1 Tax=unclassified Aurantimonas TaxID=2638230 RepID=UPI002E176DC3|nr:MULTISPECIES: SDR family oxidoreductase [unclassified Aurantimonas]MEC5292709.1 SDR family oxidoreductase [Aurantimonas sp. C2-3-R2]MEC5382928.1 SDR family oxidoreductase [Aurantimonas sp. C2-6-R+9]MEC5413743.1 SDR family oxidoreductase [Aurantimonas sp. C2-4-R8]
MRRFDGLSVLVSGAAGGFGRSIAKAFAAEGAKLLLTDLDDAALAAAAKDIPDTEIVTLAGDVSREAVAQALVETAIERFDGLDIAINNAGIVHAYKRLSTIDAAEAERVIAIDLMGVFFAMKHQLAAMEARFEREGRGGAIVNVASVAGLKGAPLLSVYAAAKHGVIGLTRSAAAETARRGIRVNAVCPSFARTAMVLGDGHGADSEEEKRIVRGIPMRRLAEVEEVVAAVLFAADPANGFMTGAVLPVDGGLSAI